METIKDIISAWRLGSKYEAIKAVSVILSTIAIIVGIIALVRAVLWYGYNHGLTM
jgi:hypothetical protein